MCMYNVSILIKSILFLKNLAVLLTLLYYLIKFRLFDLHYNEYILTTYFNSKLNEKMVDNKKNIPDTA